ncbi:hypothetical protein BH11CYA1_BH11CYA1_21450 [soil metagenome]
MSEEDKSLITDDSQITNDSHIADKSQADKSQTADESALKLARRCPQCAAEVADDASDCPVCQAELQGNFALNQELVEESVEGIITLLRAEFDLKSLRLASDTDQLIARAKIREMVREDLLPLTIFERGVVLQHILNIIFNSRDEETL